MPPNEAPSLETADSKAAVHGNVEKLFSAYSVVDPAFTQSSVALIESMGLMGELAKGATLNVAEALRLTQDERYLKAALAWLDAQGYLVESETEGHYVPSDEGKKLFLQAPKIQNIVAHYRNLMEIAKIETGLQAIGIRNALEHILGRQTETPMEHDALLAPAVTYLHESTVYDGPHMGMKAGSVLVDGGSLQKEDMRFYTSEKTRDLYFQVLHHAGLLEEESEGLYTANRKGKKALRLGGYSELALSYYDMLHKLSSLSAGTDSYGLNGTVRRDAELNARASNGILNQRVAPHIVNSLKESPILRKALDQNGGYIDYGSGGADMLMQVADSESNKVRALFGMDINPATNALAGKIVAEKKLKRSIDLVTGSIADPEALKGLKERMEKRGIQGAVASINFILHDIGPKLSVDFLRSHSAVFPKVPLVITETFKVPASVLRAHPDYQAASFYFMHDASGQHLYTEKELEAMLEGCGYEILNRHTHSTIPNEDSSSQLPYIATWITKPTE